ncbi:DUF262 domain-containing HNH endonuclease family protein [Corynebacterium argentoratense]|jgi:conserved hypothetical protein|uniref:DUF262 domain-containing protein n=1 Tax=Actinomyces bouchesdurhonensis TaxID=1852361 RepID=A0A929WVA8_9ACTO|nr:DUF262 domain-containing HNH endonuclease family protein [Corynebacterium argentoratense]MBF0966087.1 DUF262 domain-containing protein [Actinomyces bouchesdurhonensis]
MEAGKALINAVFNSSRLLKIPFYQRAYVWGEEQWERFLNDMEYVTATNRPYFLGSIILKQIASGNTWDDISDTRTVIDGQQRLTTTILFFKAMCARMGRNDLFERDFVLETGDVALLHGKHDHAAFEKVAAQKDAEPIVDEGSSIIKGYKYFLNNIDIDKVNRNVIKQNVQFVCIDLTEDEDEQQIFDTINSLGVRLTTAELLKNHFFNRENIDDYKTHWEQVFESSDEQCDYWEQEIVTGRIKRSLIDLFFDAFLQITVQDKVFAVSSEDKITYSRTGNLFQSYKDFIVRYCGGDKKLLLERMKPYAELFEKTFRPEACGETMPAMSGMERINVLIFGLKNSTLIPYVLYLRKNASSHNEEIEMLRTLESYIMRRMVVRATTKNYNRLFNSLILNEVLTVKELVDSLEANSEATTYIPDDEEVKKGFAESKLTNLQAKGILYFIESAIRPSASSTHHLGFDQYSLEHMMPKKWRNNWESLDDDMARNRDRALLTLGNLAIITSSLNSSIRDADWNAKKEGKGSKGGLKVCSDGIVTMGVANDKKVWDEAAITERGTWLADKAISVWRYATVD